MKCAEEDRVKRSRSDALEGTEQNAIALMHFLESQDLETIAAAPILVSTGLQSLSDILDKQAGINTSVADYLQQALLSMMTSAVTRIEVSHSLPFVSAAMLTVECRMPPLWQAKRSESKSSSR